MKKVTILVIILTLVGKVLGFIREMILASLYGVSDISDAYLMANNLPAIVFTMIATAFVNGFIPMYLETEKAKGRLAANQFLNNVLHTMFAICAVICILFLLFTEQSIRLLLPNANMAQLGYTILFSRITILSIFFTCVYQLFQGYLQIQGSFVIPLIFGLVLNCIFVLGIYGSKIYGLIWLPLSILIAYIIQALCIFIYAFRKDYHYKPYLNFKDVGLQKLLLMGGPLIIGSAMDTVGQMVNQALASSIDGGISYVNYSMRMGRMINGIFAPAIIGVLYPTIARFISMGDKEAVNHTFSESVRSIVLITIPATVGLIALSKPINQLIFLRGEFTKEDLIITSIASSAFALGIVSLSLREIVVRIFYGYKDMKTPTINTVGTIIFQIIFGLILSKIWGVTGIVLSMSIASTIWLVIFFFQLRHIFKGYPWQKDVLESGKILIAAILMGFISWRAYVYLENRLSLMMGLLLSVILGGLIYLIGLCLFKVEMVNKIIQVVLKKVKK